MCLRDKREQGLQRRRVQRNSKTRLLQIWCHHEYDDNDDSDDRIDDCPYDDGGCDQSGIIEGRSLKARGCPCSNALTSHSSRW